MLIESRLIDMGIILMSVLVGLLAFYILDQRGKKEKKSLLNELISQILNFIIFIWIGKILWNASTFLQDPVAVLAYPSHSEAFYIALFMIVLLLIYQSYKKRIDLSSFFHTFLYFFLTSSFVYEFIQLVYEEATYNFGYLILLAVLLVVWLVIRDRKDGLYVLFAAWSAGVLLLFTVQPFVTVFGYMIDPMFAVMILGGAVIAYFGQKNVHKRKENPK
jgi:hypothetical protein